MALYLFSAYSPVVFGILALRNIEGTSGHCDEEQRLNCAEQKCSGCGVRFHRCSPKKVLDVFIQPPINCSPRNLDICIFLRRWSSLLYSQGILK